MLELNRSDPVASQISSYLLNCQVKILRERQILINSAESTTKNIAEIAEIQDALNSNNIPNSNRKDRFFPNYKGLKGAYGVINGFFASQHRLCGGNIITKTHKEISEATGYNKRTSERITKKMESDGRLIIMRHWKNSYLYLPQNVGIESWLENFKAKFGIDLRTQIKCEIDDDNDQSRRQNVANKATKCRQDDLSSIESFRESKTSPPKKPSEPIPDKPPETDLDRIKDTIPKRWHYKLRNIDSLIEKCIDKNGLDYTLWATKNHAGSEWSFLDMLTKPEKYKTEKYSRDCESQTIAENEQYKMDIDTLASDFAERQSLNRPSSVKDQPINPRKNMAFEERRELFLSAVDPSLHEYYLAMSDYELQSRSEFQRHAY